MEEQATGQLQTLTVLAGGWHPTPATLHAFLRPRVPKWELRGFHTFLPQRWLDSLLLRFLPAYFGPRAGVQAGGD